MTESRKSYNTVPGQGKCDSCWLEKLNPVNDPTLSHWEEIIRKKEVRSFQKGEHLLFSGDAVTGIYCVKEGMVKINKRGTRDKEFVLWVAGPGDLIGLNSFISNELLTFSAQAINPVKACFIPAEELRVLLVKEPMVFVKLTEKLCSKLNYVEQRITSISRKNIKEQCAEILVSMAMQVPSPRGKAIQINYPVKDLASLIGTTRSYMYKVISDLVSSKVISVQNRKLVINNLNTLSSIAMGNDR